MSAGITIHAPFERPRLSQVLFEQPDRSFGSIASFSSNLKAIDTALLFANDEYANVALVGPSGWGKTHLLQAVGQARGLAPDSQVQYFSAVEWLSLGRADSGDPLLLDNVQDAFESARMRQSLRIALERRVRGGRRTILAFTSPRPTRQIRMFLPSAKDWVVTHLPAPNRTERVQVIEQIARAESLRLHKHLVVTLADRLKGNGRTYSGALKRLRLHGQDWLSDSAMLHAFGLLDMYFTDNLDWDLAEVALTTSELPEFRNSPVNRRNMAIYALLRIAELPEDKVAHRFGVAPSTAFHSATHFSRNLEAQVSQGAILDTFVRTVVRSV